MKVLSLLILCSITEVFPQELSYYISQSGNYSLDLFNNISIQRKQLNNGNLDVFISQDGNNFRYAFAVTEMVTEESYESLFTQEYKRSYVEGCQCQLSGDREASYKNFKGIFFDLTKEEAGNSYWGYNIATIKNGRLYNIMYLVRNGDNNNYQTEFDTIINSFKLN